MSDCTGGLDVHARSVRLSAVRGDELVGERTLGYELAEIEQQLREWGVTRCCYEAGPTGFELQRHLAGAGFDCEVIAPSLIPKRPGDRVKTDKRDARQLALLHQARMLTSVAVPDVAIEAIRDLVRVREDARLDRTGCRHRLSKFCLRHGRRLPTNGWTQQRRRWLGQQEFDHPAQQRAFDDYVEAADLADRRIERLEQDLFEYAEHPVIKDVVSRLRCIRGINTLSALVIIAECGDLTRFRSPRALMSYSGLVPSEHSSGDGRVQGKITKTGNQHLRRILIEAAWNNRRPPRVSQELAARHAGQDPRVVAHAMKCQRRLSKRWMRMTMRGKSSHNTVTAVAREMCGFVWAIANERV